MPPELSGERGRAGPIPGGAIGRLLGRVLEPLYDAAIGRRNRRFDQGIGVERLPVPVISVGNLSVGGTGKTPLTAWAVRALAGAGISAAIALRGYKSTRDTGSDEASEYQRLLPGVPVVARPDRFGAVTELLASPAGVGVACVVLDDGFQHRRLARDLDIVLLDATRDPFADRLLPAGWLREGPASLRRAGAVVLTHAESASGATVEALRSAVSEVTGGVPVYTARHTWRGFVHGESVGGPGEDVPLGHERVVAVCGIGNPGPFLEAARRSGGEVARELVYPDHAVYGPARVREIDWAMRSTGATAVLTTEKDWSRLRGVRPEARPWPVVRPRLELQVEPAGPLVAALIAAARSGPGLGVDGRARGKNETAPDHGGPER